MAPDSARENLERDKRSTDRQTSQIDRRSAEGADGRQMPIEKAFLSIPQLAVRWCCSRATVYNRIRGKKVLDFAAPGHKGKKLVPAEVVEAIERESMRVWR